jgi:drug/metabolite transporter (DMT)-like permease
MNQGFRYCKSWEGGLFLMAEVIFTAILGILYLGEPMTWRFWLGGFLVLASAIALNRGNARRISHRGIASTGP